MTTYAYDMLGTSLAAVGNGNAEAFSLTAFGDTIPGNAESAGAARSPLPVPQLDRQSICGGGSPFYTGKPNVPGLGHAFLFRNYRASLGKWQTSDPIGYPDGWNQLAYCGNGVTMSLDANALWTIQIGWTMEIGAASGILQTLGITFGYSSEKGFTFGFYSTTGAGSYVGAGASTGLEVVVSNSSSISDLAGVGYEGSANINGAVYFGVSGSIPVNIADTGYYSFGFSFGISTPGIPLEVQNYVTYTAIVEIYE